MERGTAKPLYSPRRLAVLLPGVASEQPEQRTEVLGPYLNIALDANGAPTRALEGFAAKAGVAWDALDRTTDAKGERFVHRAVTPGARAADLLPVEYFHVVFTLPAGIAQIAFWNKKAVYDLLFRTSAETVLTLAADPRPSA